MNTRRAKSRSFWRRLRYFFPLQLLVLHVKKSHLLLLLWGLLFAITMEGVAAKFGVPYQFLVPEYRGQSDVIAFGIVGFGLGGFITAFNLYSYIMHGYRFPFIATLNRPFQKFSLNNFVIPGLFILSYAYASARFQLEKECFSASKVFLNILGFGGGIFFFQSLSYLYFTITNKDATAFGEGKKRYVEESSPVDSPLHHRMKWIRMRSRMAKWHVETYMSNAFKLSLARDSKHYDKEVLEKVFSQNHINAARFEIALVVSFLFIGIFREIEFFIIPAAASAILFFTMLIMLLSALHSWIKGWTISFFILVFVVLNFFYTDLKWITVESRAQGLRYDEGLIDYEPQGMMATDEMVNADKASTIAILENWKKNTGEAKPKLVIIDCSGGGSRSAFWSMRSLMHADNATYGELMKHTVLMTGASGGMFGAAYLRELVLLNKEQGINYRDTLYAERMAKDVLNPVILSLTTNDWFIRFQKTEYLGQQYTKDRGTAFEFAMNGYTEGHLNKPISAYAHPEKEAKIPMMVLTPTIVNDGRRLLISAQPMSYLTRQETVGGIPEDIEFSRLFKDKHAEDLNWLNALRMNATFPYIFPMTTLPTNPEMKVMDAGLRDNFGMKTTSTFLHTFHDWIEENTSGVVILQVRDLPKYLDLGAHDNSLFSKFTTPLGSVYGNVTKSQDYNNDQMLEYLRSGFSLPIDYVTFELNQTRETRISLSWHLTNAEKNHIRQATNNEYFRYELERLKTLLLLNSKQMLQPTNTHKVKPVR